MSPEFCPLPQSNYICQVAADFSDKLATNFSDKHTLFKNISLSGRLKDKRLQGRHLKAFIRIFGNLAIMAVAAVDPGLHVRGLGH